MYTPRKKSRARRDPPYASTRPVAFRHRARCRDGRGLGVSEGVVHVGEETVDCAAEEG